MCVLNFVSALLVCSCVSLPLFSKRRGGAFGLCFSRRFLFVSFSIFGLFRFSSSTSSSFDTERFIFSARRTIGERGKEEELKCACVQGGGAFCTKLGTGRSLDGTEKGFFFFKRESVGWGKTDGTKRRGREEGVWGKANRKMWKIDGQQSNEETKKGKKEEGS